MEIRIGRSEESDVVIRNQSVSRNHGILMFENGKYYFTDLNSSNGSYVNGNRIEGTIEIQYTDILKLGTELIPWNNYVNSTNDSFKEPNLHINEPTKPDEQGPTQIHETQRIVSDNSEQAQHINQEVQKNQSHKQPKGIGCSAIALSLVSLFFTLVGLAILVIN